MTFKVNCDNPQSKKCNVNIPPNIIGGNFLVLYC